MERVSSSRPRTTDSLNGTATLTRGRTLPDSPCVSDQFPVSFCLESAPLSCASNEFMAIFDRVCVLSSLVLGSTQSYPVGDYCQGHPRLWLPVRISLKQAPSRVARTNALVRK